MGHTPLEILGGNLLLCLFQFRRLRYSQCVPHTLRAPRLGGPLLGTLDLCWHTLCAPSSIFKTISKIFRSLFTLPLHHLLSCFCQISLCLHLRWTLMIIFRATWIIQENVSISRSLNYTCRVLSPCNVTVRASRGEDWIFSILHNLT